MINKQIKIITITKIGVQNRTKLCTIEISLINNGLSNMIAKYLLLKRFYCK
jgi:hypothetical protein